MVALPSDVHLLKLLLLCVVTLMRALMTLILGSGIIPVDFMGLRNRGLQVSKPHANSACIKDEKVLRSILGLVCKKGPSPTGFQSWTVKQAPPFLQLNHHIPNASRKARTVQHSCLGGISAKETSCKRNAALNSFIHSNLSPHLAWLPTPFFEPSYTIGCCVFPVSMRRLPKT